MNSCRFNQGLDPALKVQNPAYRPPYNLVWKQMMMQKTLKEEIKIQGVGLHSGIMSVLTVKPAPADFGIVFSRIDLPGKPQIRALYSNVIDTRNCTCLGDAAGNKVSTIEHLMSALYMAGIDNALIELDNPEVPIMDGSAEEFFVRLRAAAKTEQNKQRRFLKILRTVGFCDDKGNKATLGPSADGLHIKFEIEFPSAVVGRQVFDKGINDDVFASELARARTFCEKSAVDYLKSVGLIKGGSLENAVVLDGDKLLNPEGFRVQNECVNHKVLDAVGDLYTSGFRIIGELSAFRTGHYHMNELLKKLFEDSSNYEII